MIESRSKAQKTRASQVSNENFSEILWPSGWALDQVMSHKGPKTTLLMMSLAKNP